MGKLKYHVVLEKQIEGGYAVYIPELPGCISQGDTEKDALANIKEAAELYLEELTASKLEKITTIVRFLLRSFFGQANQLKIY